MKVDFTEKRSREETREQARSGTEGANPDKIRMNLSGKRTPLPNDLWKESIVRSTQSSRSTTEGANPIQG
jgi:hypothetical protein